MKHGYQHKSFQKLIQLLPDMMICVDENLQLLYTNELPTIIGHISNYQIQTVNPEASDVQRFLSNGFAAVKDTGSLFEDELHVLRGADHIVHNWRFIPDFEAGKLSAVLAIGRDVSVHRRTEESYRTLFNTMLNGFALHKIILDDSGAPVDYQFVEVNPAFEKMTGLKRERVVGRTVLEVLPNTEKYWIENYGAVALTGTTHVSVDYAKELNKYFRTVSYRPFADHFVVVFDDVSEQMRAEADQRLLFHAIDQAAEAVIIADRQGEIQFVNPAFEKLTGFVATEAIGQNPRFLQSGDTPASVYKDLWEKVLLGENWTGEFINRKKDGTVYTEAALISPVFNQAEHITHFVSIKRDITLEIQAERRQRQTEKMESLGHLAGGIAHDLNNILGAFLGYSEILRTDLEDMPLQKKYVDQLLVASERAKGLVSQILSFSRQQEAKKSNISLRLVVKEVVGLLQASLPASVELKSRLNAENCSVFADHNKIHEVVLNLCTNASHAMGNKGTLEITFKEVQCAAPIHGILGILPPGNYSVVSVQDTGCGISQEVLSRMFDPYFTTKPIGEGTGLGLSVVFQVVREHDGNIVVTSEVDHGSLFTVYLPRVDHRSRSEIDRDSMTIPYGYGRVLFVDDERSICTIVFEMLTGQGYDVIIAPSGNDALEILAEDDVEIDLIITDFSMPKMTGVELIEKVKARGIEIPILICTGFGEGVDERTATSLGASGFLAKPFRKSELVAAVRSILNPVSQLN